MRGSIQKRGKGSWRLVFDLERDHAGTRKQKTVTFRGTKRDAEAELSRILAEIKNGGFIEPSTLKVSVYLDRWLEMVVQTTSTKTFERYSEICRNHLVPALGCINLQKLKPLHIQEAYTGFLKSGRRDGNGGLSPRTVLHHHRVFKRALKQAVRWQLINTNPADAVEPPRVSRKEVKFLDMAETATLLRATEGRTIYPIVLLAVTTGMRRGEVLGLRWKDLDLDKGFLQVSQTLEQTRMRGLRAKEPKSKASQRRISLPPMTVHALRRHMTERSEIFLRLGVGRRNDGLVFLTPEGKPRSPRALTKEFDRLVRRLDIPRITFHGLRHTHITHLLMDGEPIKVVSERAGHASVSITLDVYGHVLPDRQEALAANYGIGLLKALAEHGSNEG